VHMIVANPVDPLQAVAAPSTVSALPVPVKELLSNTQTTVVEQLAVPAATVAVEGELAVAPTTSSEAPVYGVATTGPNGCTIILFPQQSVYFDFTPLAGDKPGLDTSYHWKINVCEKTADPLCVVQGGGAPGSMCQYNLQDVYQHTIAAFAGAFPTYQLVNQADPTAGVLMNFANGDPCGTPPAPRTAAMKFTCSQQPGGTYTVTPVGACGYTVTFASTAGCSHSGQPSGGGGGGGLSGGSIFLIIFFVTFPVYVAAGCIYKRQKMGTTGMESCPNVDFWRSLPGLIKDGFVFTFSKIKACCGKGDASYQEVK